MLEIYDLKLIKKYYGEKMMHLCRELFPSILEQEGLLFKLIDKKFNHSKFLYDDIVNDDKIADFKNIIYNEIDVENDNKLVVDKTPKELLDEAGYILYECKTEEDIQSFKKYYAKGEELCTFKGNRLISCYVFFAVSKNIENIKRENFKYPARQDEYGTSVISIQFSKGDINTLSIKNRYNHKVNNPDATFSNDLDNIIEGLTESFCKYYNLNINSNHNNNFNLNNYVLANNQKYYKYNYEINNTYYCPDNIIIDNFEVKKYDKEKYIVFDVYILDLVNKKIYCEHNDIEDDIEDGFINSLDKIEKIGILNDKEIQLKKIIINNNIVITINKQNQIISYKNEIVSKIDDNFLYDNKCLKTISLPNVLKIGHSFLAKNKNIESINLPKVIGIGNSFLVNNQKLKEINLPKVEYIGDSFLRNNYMLTSIDFPNLQVIGDNFLKFNKKINSISLPLVKKIGDFFLFDNEDLKEINLLNVSEIEDGFLWNNYDLDYINLPSVYKIGGSFLRCNKRLKYISLLQLEEVGDYFLSCNECLDSVNLPKLEFIDNSFLVNNQKLKEINLPKVEYIRNNFLRNNYMLTSIDFPNLQVIGDDFLKYNEKINSISLPLVKRIGDSFLHYNKVLKEINLPKVRDISCNFLCYNKILKSLFLPEVIEVGSNFLELNDYLEVLDLPKVKLIGHYFLYNNSSIETLNMPNLDYRYFDDMNDILKHKLLKNDNSNIVKVLKRKRY